MEHGVCRRPVLGEGVEVPAVAGSGETAGEDIIGVRVAGVLGGLEDRLSCLAGAFAVITVVDVLQSLLYNIAEIFSHSYPDLLLKACLDRLPALVGGLEHAAVKLRQPESGLDRSAGAAVSAGRRRT